ncbi:MAG: phage integrase SAM-like domain-containing protein [Bacteroidota bacterium]
MTTEKYLSEFLTEKCKAEDIYLKQLNYKFLKDFEYWLREDRPCSYNTVIKHIQRLRKIVNMAVANDWLKGTVHEFQRKDGTQRPRIPYRSGIKGIGRNRI